MLAEEDLDGGADFLTLLKGEELDRETSSKRYSRGSGDLDDELEVEVRDGGQPLYPLQMVAE